MPAQFEALEERIYKDTQVSEGVKSSHWKYYTKDFSFDKTTNSVAGISGFGNNSPRSLLRKTYHKVFQKHYFSQFGDYWQFDEYRAAQHCATEQKRALDLDLLRHVFTFHMFRTQFDFLNLKKNCCVIGDGQSNFCSLALKLKSFGKIISINLPEVLLSDLQLIKNLKSIAEKDIRYATDPTELRSLLDDDETKLILISASNCSIIKDMGIDFFVNIASMQEMTNALVDQYFELIKSNQATFYCCNREEKTLPAGERLIFEQYPWGNGKILLDELCPWHQYFYRLDKRLKFKTPYDGPIRHRVVKYS